MESFMAMEPSDGDEERISKLTHCYLDTQEDRGILHQSAVLTCNALTLLIDGVMRRTRCIDGTAQLLRFLVGCRLYELNRWLEDSELQSHSHLWENKAERGRLSGWLDAPDDWPIQSKHEPIPQTGPFNSQTHIFLKFTSKLKHLYLNWWKVWSCY